MTSTHHTANLAGGETTAPKHHHAGREAAVGAGIGGGGAHVLNKGDANHPHHPVRDALIGAGAGAETAHLRNEHEGNKAEKHATGQPTFGDKISGTIDKMVGEITRNPAKVQEGEMKKGQV